MEVADLTAEYKKFSAHYKNESDRAVVLLASSYLDEILERLLSKRLVPCKRTKALFSGYAPLATFSARIDIAFAVGIIPGHLARDLHIIRKLRNLCAHKADKLEFSSEEITQLCNSLSHSHGPPRTDGSTGSKINDARVIFLNSIFFCNLHMNCELTRITEIKAPKFQWKEVIGED